MTWATLQNLLGAIAPYGFIIASNSSEHGLGDDTQGETGLREAGPPALTGSGYPC